MLRHYDITPVIVFDGGYLPGKAGTEQERAKRREDSRKLGLELEKAGKISQARLEFQRAIDITPEMARQFIEELYRARVSYIVAPYEADAQLVYLERQGMISGILSEDSDLLVFGAKCLLTKLDPHGGCTEINKADFTKCTEVSLAGWSDVEFRQMAILSGCDYLPSIPGMGLKTAYRMVRQHKTVEKIIKMLQFDGKYTVPHGYLDSFRQADRTFLHQWVFDPIERKVVHHTPLSSSIGGDDLQFIGTRIEDHIAMQIAYGNINPITKEPLSRVQLPMTWSLKTGGGKPIDQYFKKEKNSKHKRIPLGEMYPNDFKVTNNRIGFNDDVVIPDFENLGNGRQNSEHDENDVGDEISSNDENYEYPERAPIQLPRTYMLPGSVTLPDTSAPPPPQRQYMPPALAVLPDTSAPLPPPRRASGASRLRRSNSILESPPKRVRLCADRDDDIDVSLPPTRSRFFPGPVTRGNLGKKNIRKKDECDIFSDDSVEDIMANTPEEIMFNSKPVKKEKMKKFEVFRDDSVVEGSVSESQETAPALTRSSSIMSSFEAPPTPVDTPTTKVASAAISKFAFTPGSASSNARPRHVSANGFATPVSNSFTAGARHVFANGLATPVSTPSSVLQRLGARALGMAITPPYTPSPPLTNVTTKKSGVPFPEVARLENVDVNLNAIEVASRVPLPPPTSEEDTALMNGGIDKENKLGGSEDLIIHDSEEEEEEDDLHNKPTLNLSRFSYSA